MDIREVDTALMRRFILEPYDVCDGLYFSEWVGGTWMCLAVIKGAVERHRSAKINAALDWLHKCKNQFYGKNL